MHPRKIKSFPKFRNFQITEKRLTLRKTNVIFVLSAPKNIKKHEKIKIKKQDQKFVAQCNKWNPLEYQLNVPYKSQKASKPQMIFCLIFLFYHRFKWNDFYQSTLTRNTWTFIQTFLRLCNILTTNKFITPVPVYEMKYLLKYRYWNYQFNNFIDTYDIHA